MRCVLIGFLIVIGMEVLAQDRKMPPLTFKAHSLEFANANRSYSASAGFTETDTLLDGLILSSLVDILMQNPQLRIELAGHTSFNEVSELGLERAETVAQLLIEEGIEPLRLKTTNLYDSAPIISIEVLRTLPDGIEQEAAHQRNRRVEVKVISN